MQFVKKLFAIPNIKILYNYPISKHTGYKIGGNCSYFIQVYTLDSLTHLLNLCNEYQIKYKFLGNGTNVLVSDGGFNGIVISLKSFNKIFVNGNIVTAYSGANLCAVINRAIKSKLCGGEALCGIPATIGGAVIMNASAFGISVGDLIQFVTVLENGALITYPKAQCGFIYRASKFTNKNIPIISATFVFERLIDGNSSCLITDCAKVRKTLQPNGKSCGCIFKNPPNDYAGRLIDQSGLKGLKVGGAWVSEKHANFIMTDRSACSLDIYRLIQIIKQKVYGVFNILLEEEIEYWGEFNDSI